MKKIEIEIPDGKRAEWVNGVLTLVDDSPKDVRDRIKTFDDACAELGEEHPLVKEYWGVVNVGLDITQDLIAYLKLRIITAALNEGWKPQFTEGERRWYAYYNFVTEEQYYNMTKAEMSRVPLWSHNNASAYGGLVYAFAGLAGPCSIYGVRLAFKSEELAGYAAKQFIDIYADYCLGSLEIPNN